MFTSASRYLRLAARLMFAALMAWPRAAGAEYAGYVLEVSGHWSTDGAPRRELGAASPVDEDVAVRRRPPLHRSDSIVIIGRNGRELARQSCAKDSACRAPIRLPAGPRQDGPLERVVAAAMQRWRAEEARFTVLSGRGGLRLYEGVVPLSRTGADLAVVAGDLPPGTYTLAWRPLSPRPSAGRAPVRCRFERVAGPAAAVAAVPELEPGLYQLAAYAGAAPGVDEEERAEAWVLVVPEASYPGPAARFQSAVESAQTWAADTNGETPRRFLRAVLLDLAAAAATSGS
jgi:hypothetical protein